MPNVHVPDPLCTCATSSFAFDSQLHDHHAVVITHVHDSYKCSPCLCTFVRVFEMLCYFYRGMPATCAIHEGEEVAREQVRVCTDMVNVFNKCIYSRKQTHLHTGKCVCLRRQMCLAPATNVFISRDKRSKCVCVIPCLCPVLYMHVHIACLPVLCWRNELHYFLQQ